MTYFMRTYIQQRFSLLLPFRCDVGEGCVDVVYVDGDLCEPDDPDDEGQPQGQPRPNVFYATGRGAPNP
jgi:hypothetical protein